MHLLCILLVFGFAASAINFTTLIDNYVLTCGHQFCNHYQDLPDTSHLTHICPDCSCDTTCLVNGNCCLDKFLSFNVQCINTTIISNFEQDSDSIDEDFFLMRTSCPDDIDIDLKQKCERNNTFSEQLQQHPVTSKISHFTYRNIFCADCHNESEVESWTLKTECQEFIDFNEISSTEEIFESAVDRKCKFSSFIDHPFVRGCNKVYGTNVIASCNVTGTWASYDRSIEWGCLHYDKQYRVFRNVFCYICNPPVEIKPTILHCNVTGNWNRYDSAVVTACENLAKTPTTYPFKNIYCYSCNVEFEKQHFAGFDDAIADIVETVSNGRYFEYTFATDILINDMFVYDLFENSDENYTQIRGAPSITDIYELYYAMSGNGHFCKNISSLLVADDICSCDDSCHFNLTHPCCIDATFRHSTSCVNSWFGSFLVYDGCENIARGFESLSHRCQNLNNTNDFLYSLPVYDVFTLISYKNIYCGLCRYFTDDIATFDVDYFISTAYQFKPWRLTLLCEVNIPIQYHVYLSDLLESRYQSICNVSTTPDDMCDKKCVQNNVNNTCEEINPSLAWACKEYNTPPTTVDFYYKLNDSSLGQYSNIFCAMCGIDNKINVSLIGICNLTGLWDEYDEQIKTKCIHLPEVAYHQPYKNIFCKMCNEESMQYHSNYRPDISCDYNEDIDDVLHFRSLFSIELYDNINYGSSLTERCHDNQVYDIMLEKCRDIVCYPGRALVNNTCIPVLPYTSNLGFIFSVGMDVHLSTTIEEPVYFMEILRFEVILYMKNYIQLKDPFTELIILSANKTCSYKEIWTDPSVHLSLFIKIFISHIVDRQKIEYKLIQLLKHEFFLNIPCSSMKEADNTHDWCPIRCSFNYDEKSVYLPTLLHLNRVNKNCVSYQDMKIVNADYYVHSYVNNLLQCPQLQMEPDEIKIFDDQTTVKILFLDAVLTYYDFYLIKPNTASICVNKFLELLQRDTKISIIKRVMVACTVLSLIALFLTFLTYCLFPPLRTVPGKNNMSLVSALFCALALLEFGIEKTENNTGCIIIGVTIHYFWLCTFFCLNVCSFHMYRTFRKCLILYSSDTKKERKRLLFYILYSYGAPLLIVSLNIITIVLTNRHSYGYGGNLCFISNQLSLICSFVSPVAVICFVNLFLFVSTAKSIVSTPKIQTDDSFSQNKVHFTVYLKLFIITGGSWIIQILDSFLPVSVFSIIVSFLNSFQGIFIFLSYICNKRVLGMYRNAIRQLLNDSKFSNKQSSVTRSSALSSITGNVFPKESMEHSDYTVHDSGINITPM